MQIKDFIAAYVKFVPFCQQSWLPLMDPPGFFGLTQNPEIASCHPWMHHPLARAKQGEKKSYMYHLKKSHVAIMLIDVQTIIPTLRQVFCPVDFKSEGGSSEWETCWSQQVCLNVFPFLSSLLFTLRQRFHRFTFLWKSIFSSSKETIKFETTNQTWYSFYSYSLVPHHLQPGLSGWPSDTLWPQHKDHPDQPATATFWE